MDAIEKQMHLQRLIYELQAIELWDRQYFSAPCTTWCDVQAFHTRQTRRKDILMEIIERKKAGVTPGAPK